MKKKLIIVESPAKCKKIVSFLDESYSCIASYGHFRMCNKLSQVNKESFIMSFDADPKKRKYIDIMRQEIRKAGSVIIATDDDREGEAIGWHILDMFRLPLSTPRIVFHEITANAVRKSLETPRTIDMNYVRSQHARQCLDLLIGYTMSPLLWNYICNKPGMSAGRCQTPALRIIYDNHKENQNKKPTIQHHVVGMFTDKNIEFTLTKPICSLHLIRDFLDDSITHTHILKKDAPKAYTETPPGPFQTSSLQQACNNTFQMSPGETMKICQQLYEKGFITYMRTNSIQFSRDFIQETFLWIEKTHGGKYISENPEKLSLDESRENCAHEAIRPTLITRAIVDAKSFEGSKKYQQVYSLIRNRSIESLMNDAKGMQIKLCINAPHSQHYMKTAKQYTFLGWRKQQNKYEDDALFQYCSLLKEQTYNYSQIYTKPFCENTQNHYHEAKLIQKLEALGIGRPSTYASIVEKIQSKTYVKKGSIKASKIDTQIYSLIGNKVKATDTQHSYGGEKQKLLVQPIGLTVVEWLYKHYEPLFTYGYTASMEEQLDLISEGKASYQEVCKQCYDFMKELIQKQKKECGARVSFMIDESHEFMFGKNGPVVKYTPRVQDDDRVQYEQEDGTQVVAKKKAKVNKKPTEKPIFYSVKKGVTMENVGDKSLEEIIEISSDRHLGLHNGEDVVLKQGRYGTYVAYSGQNLSLKYNTSCNSKSFDTIFLSDVLDVLKGSSESEENNGNVTGNKLDPPGSQRIGILRKISDTMSIRSGPYGEYIYYKPEGAKKPQFIRLRKAPFNYSNEDSQVIFDWAISQKKSK